MFQTYEHVWVTTEGTCGNDLEIYSDKVISTVLCWEIDAVWEAETNEELLLSEWEKVVLDLLIPYYHDL